MKKNCQKLIAFACLFLSYSKSIGQETSFKINPTITQQTLAGHNMSVDAFPATYKQVEYPLKDSIVKRQAYMIAGLSININSIEGEFTKLPKEYRAVFADIKGKYVKDELVIKEFADSREMSREGDLLKRVGTDEYIWIVSDDNFVNRVIEKESENEMLTMIHRLGYKEYKDKYGVMYVRSKTSEINLDDRTLAELKRDPAYISKLDTDQIKIASLVKQTIPHSKTLDNYISIYNIKRSRMSMADLKAWKLATANAQKLNNQIRVISKKYDGNTSFSLLDKSRTLDKFSDNLLASKGVLGM